MNLDKMLQNAAVIGAAGKMGRGIALLLLQEMMRTDLNLQRPPSQLYLIDNSSTALKTLKTYLNSQMLKFAEKNMIALREWYREDESLVDNSEVIDAFLKDCHFRIHTGSSLERLSSSHMVFEAVFEDLDIKSGIYDQLTKICPNHCCYFTNTSSIPIAAINERNHLNNQIIGFHFYNPPAVQKLVELISMKNTSIELIETAQELIGRLGKKMVPSHDQAGFIGNGHFIREGLCFMKQLSNFKMKSEEAILLTNSISQQFMIRPMGIFQLIDYVGLDVFKMICRTMANYHDEDFSCPLIDQLLTLKVKGGQWGDGSQKDGFLKYEQGKICAIYSLAAKDYISSNQLESATLPWVEATGLSPKSWKELSKDKHKNDWLKKYFSRLSKNTSLLAKQTISYLKQSQKISRLLVSNGVAASGYDVSAVMTNGFYHLYGPDSNLLKHLGDDR